MTTDRQRAQYRAEQDLIIKAAEALRKQSRRQQAESQVGRAPVVPADRYVFVGLLDELALAAGRGELPEGVRRAGLELCEAMLADAATFDDRMAASMETAKETEAKFWQRMTELGISEPHAWQAIRAVLAEIQDGAPHTDPWTVAADRLAANPQWRTNP
ncbi:hypothetical protein SAMN05216215_108731 [Saccharopolyspora shandongensis]|uniref:Uncharacterized protein n=1 Tax=Saccharopolyspora shandongensis TaxID=418495 RepID=A0A1H3TQ26_9PSEU|nr:hypothetical protein [Saccharopolyspora shandongensis]SDZ51439.1 hypothetical protein SAMN05216215_108731 [Saccharopolyspora shandongensis]